MYFPKYWGRGSYTGTRPDGTPVETQSWGWSEVSIEDARWKGTENAHRAALANWDQASRRDAYLYADRPLREPVLRIIASDSAAGLEAVVSRNSYGSEVLNTNLLVFADVDIELPKEKKGLFSSLFGKRKEPPVSPRVSLEEEKIKQLLGWQDRNSNYSFRIYRTAAGLRYVMTSHLLGPQSDLVRELFRACGTDRKYGKLCDIQKSFRARLTPKHWRCGVRKPPVRFPFETPEERAKSEKWQLKYSEESKKFATCELIKEIGSKPAREDISRVLDEHDRITGVRSGLVLA